MNTVHAPLSVHGECIGDLVAVGNAVRLFTVRRELKPIDGKLFASQEAARRVAMKLLLKSEGVRSTVASDES